MPNLQADQVLDELILTQKNLGRGSFTDISTSLQDHVFFKRLIQQKSKEETGYALQWNIMKTTSGNARRTGLLATDSTNQADVMAVATAPWTHYTTSAVIDRRQISMNSAPEKIVDRVTVARADALTDLAKLMEPDGWAVHPGSGTTDQLYGIPYWVCWTDNSGTNANGGFDGGNPSGHTGAGGLAVASAPNFNNWCAKYTAMTKTDGIKKMREAAVKCGFAPPVQTPGYGTGTPSYGYYAPYSVISALETALESQNDNLGNSVSSKDGMTLFRRVPVEYVAALDSKGAAAPVYGINWDEFDIGVLAGENLRETPWEKSGTAHTAYQMFVDISLNTRCYNRRAQFVLATTTVA